jgi:hypothetical protein
MAHLAPGRENALCHECLNHVNKYFRCRLFCDRRRTSCIMSSVTSLDVRVSLIPLKPDQSPASAEPASRRFDSSFLARDTELLLKLPFREVCPPLRIERVGMLPDFDMTTDQSVACVRQTRPDHLSVRFVFLRFCRERTSSLFPSGEAVLLDPVSRFLGMSVLGPLPERPPDFMDHAGSQPACAVELRSQLLSIRLRDGFGFLQRSSARHPHSTPCGVPASMRRSIGFTMFRLNSVDDLAPTCYTGSHIVRAPAYWRQGA